MANTTPSGSDYRPFRTDKYPSPIYAAMSGDEVIMRLTLKGFACMKTMWDAGIVTNPARKVWVTPSAAVSYDSVVQLVLADSGDDNWNVMPLSDLQAILEVWEKHYESGGAT